MATPIDTNELRDYVLLNDRELPEEQRSTFHLATLPFRARCKAEAQHLEMHMGGDVRMNADWKRQLLRIGLRGWSNFKDPRDGEDIPFDCEGSKTDVWGVKVDAPTDRTLGNLHPDDVTELCNAILEAQRLSAEAGKG